MARHAVPAAGPIAPAPWHKPHRPEEARDCQQRGEENMLFRLSFGGDAGRPDLSVPSAADLSADPAFDPGPELAIPVWRALDLEPAGDDGGAAADIPTVLTKLKVPPPVCLSASCGARSCVSCGPAVRCSGRTLRSRAVTVCIVHQCDTVVDCACLCPQKWGTYTSVATGPCASSKFIAMKTPLSHEARTSPAAMPGNPCLPATAALTLFSSALILHSPARHFATLLCNAGLQYLDQAAPKL